MFNSSSFDKSSSVAPENFSSGRNNISNRFPVGITSLGDENQQIRIQLAVHKYNNLSNNALNNRRCLISPIRHSFLKNSPKAKCYESDSEPVIKNERKCGNRYEGVGVFPTVHLKRNSVLYRPIRRFNEVKVPYPELPVNRFLNNLPELCPELKSNTRSVLDVLQDLSRKRIHSKDEGDCSKIRSMGLGGDIPPEGETIYKPLFVQRPKINTVYTRDNTTQTLSSHGLNTAISLCNDSSSKVEVSDSKAELRRRLANQNNEIFASLSSSVSSSVAVKRKIDKAENVKEIKQFNDVLGVKRPKLLENHVNGCEEYGTLKFVNGFTKANSNDNLTKANRKNKLNESNSVSPNRDRLTKIFLDMCNTSPKAQVFQTNSSLSITENSIENNVPVSGSSSLSSLNKTNTFSEEVGKSVVDGELESKSTLSDKELTTPIISPNLNFTSAAKIVMPTTSDSEKKDRTESNNVLNFLTSKSDHSNSTSNIPKLTFTSTQLNFKSSSAPNINFGTPHLKAPEPCGTQSGAVISTNTNFTSENTKMVSKNVDTSGAGTSPTDKNNCDNSLNAGKPFTFGVSDESGPQKPDFNTFKVGVEAGVKSTQNQQLVLNPSLNSFLNTVQTSKTDTPTATTLKTSANSVSVNTTPQFSFGAKATNVVSTTVTSLPTSSIQFGQTISTNSFSNSCIQSAISTSAKPVYPFGQTALSTSNQQNSSENTNKVDDKSDTSKMGPYIPTIVTKTPISSGTINSNLFSQSIQSSGTFTFGQKSGSVESSNNSSKEVFGTGESIVGNPMNQNSSFGQNTSNQTNAFPQRSTFETVVSTQGNTLIPASSVQNTSFSQNSTLQTSSVITEVQNSGTNSLFTFGQKPAAPEVSSASQGAGVSVISSTEQKSQSPFSFTFAQKSEAQDTNQSKSETGLFEQKNKTNLFSLGQKASEQESVKNNGGNTTTQTNPFGETLPKPLMQSPVKPLLFGQNATQAPSTCQTTNPVTTFGQSQNSAPQPTIAFGTKSESVSFGQSSTPAFGQSNTFTTTSPVFGGTTTQSLTGFVAPTTSQSIGGFGSPSTQSLSTFAAPASNQSVNGFGAPTTIQSSTGFGTAATGFSTTTPTQSSSSFGTPVTQSASRFGVNSGSLATFTQTFGQNTNKSNTSFPQTSTYVFGQTTINQNQANGTGFSSPPNSNLGNIFGQANKVQNSPFGQNSTSQSFGTQMKYPFGMSTTNNTDFTSTPPSTTSSSLFNFGGNAPGQGSSYSFGGTTSSGSTSAQTPFTFNSPSGDAFKFGASTTKEGSGFGVTNTSTFSFGAQMNNNVSSEAKPQPQRTAFNFGSSQVSPSASVFNFGSAPSSSVFSFGGSGSSGSGSSFSFGTPQPGGSFGLSPSPATPFLPGTFSIGSGSSQSRPRASSRLRRRP